VFSWYDIITCEKKTNHRCALSNAFSTIFLFFMFLNIQIDLIILKTNDQQFTLTTKKSLHIIFNKFFPIVNKCEDIAQQSCAMVPRWQIFGDYLGPAFPASRVQHISHLHSKFALGPHHV